MSFNINNNQNIIHAKVKITKKGETAFSKSKYLFIIDIYITYLECTKTINKP